MTAINNLKITSNNDAIDGLKSKKNDSGFKSIFNSLEISDLNIQENPKNIENNSKDTKKKNVLNEENPISLKKQNENSDKEEKNYSEKQEKSNDVKKLTQNLEENNIVNINDSSSNTTQNIEILKSSEHSNLKEQEISEIISGNKKSNLKTFHFDFELINEEATKEKKIVEKPGINIDSLLLKGKIVSNQEKNNDSSEQKREIKAITIDELKKFFSEKEFKDFETLVSNKEKLLGTKIYSELNLKKDFIEKISISKPTPLNLEIKKIDIKKLDSDQTFENQFSDLLDDFDSAEEENQYVDLDKSKSIREQLIRKNEISQNLIQRFSEFLGSRIINQINAGRWETNIVLRPERLGKLNVKINLDNGEFKANFSTSNSVSRDILIEAIPKLKFNLENSGMNVASVNVDVFSSSDKNQGNQKNYILNQELNRTNQTDSEDEVMDTVSVQKINFSVDGIDIVI